MIIEVTGTSTRNKGAELMLVAIREHYAEVAEVYLAVDQFFGTYAEKARYGLLQKVALGRIGRTRAAVELLPRGFRRAYGLLRDDEVDVLLDAAGFAFGDQHPVGRTTAFAERVEAAKAANKKVVLLPQAFGPFNQPKTREGFERIVQAADLVFARDDVSMQHVRSVVGDQEHVRQAPDFTNLVKPELSVESDLSDRVCIIPNQRMVEKADTGVMAAAYVPLIGRCLEALEEAGLRPVLLLHGRDDAELAREIQQHVGREIPLHAGYNPVELKRFLGESHLVIGSRFHALVGSLSQGVPTIGTSWSHKYEMLFDEYGCREMLLSVPANGEDVRAKIEHAIGNERSTLRSDIANHAERLRKKSKEMWAVTDHELGIANQAPEVIAS